MRFGDTRLPESFWDLCVPEPNTGCWLWIGALGSRGRARYTIPGRGGASEPAARFALETITGPTPRGAWVMVRCAANCCANPQHAVVMTVADVNREQGERRRKQNKKCRRGHEYTPENTDYHYGGARRCRACFGAAAKARSVSEDEKRRVKISDRRFGLRKKFGLTLEAYEAMVAAQGDRCLICRRNFDQSSTATRACVDHDHATGAIRGVLCGNCNTGLGVFGDDPERMRSAIEYLARSRECQEPEVPS